MNFHSRDIPWAAIGLDNVKVNGHLKGARNVTLQALLPPPRGRYGDICQEPTNPDFIKLVETADVGPFMVTGLKPAVATLREIMADIKTLNPGIYERLGCDVMLCCRMVRGSQTTVSNHSWGIAIDLTIDGDADPFQSDSATRAVMEIYPHFVRHGFVWGAVYDRQDALHFEASDQLIRKWAANDELDRPVPSGILRTPTFGDRGPDIERLQSALNLAMRTRIFVDGILGRATLAAIIQFQATLGLPADGVLGKHTRDALGL